MKLLKIFLMIMVSINCSMAYASTYRNWQISPAFIAAHNQEYSAPCIPLMQKKASDNDEHKDETSSFLLSYDNAQRLITIATIIFATVKIYERYQLIGVSAPQIPDPSWTDTIKNYLIALCPAPLHSVGIYGAFCIDSTTIVFEALIYKTIGKLLLMCAYGDISDLLGSVVHGGVHAAKLLV